MCVKVSAQVFWWGVFAVCSDHLGVKHVCAPASKLW
jgi:hypothetical protein